MGRDLFETDAEFATRCSHCNAQLRARSDCPSFDIRSTPKSEESLSASPFDNLAGTPIPPVLRALPVWPQAAPAPAANEPEIWAAIQPSVRCAPSRWRAVPWFAAALESLVQPFEA